MTYTNLLVATWLTALALTPISNAHSCPQDWVNAHNKFRAADCVPPVVWNDTLAAYAQDYANKRTGDCAMQHSDGPYGENLAKVWEVLTAAVSVEMWAGEKKDYDYETNTCRAKMCGHYTQVVWRDTARIGCATAKCNVGYVYAVCEYDPPGNYVDEKPF